MKTERVYREILFRRLEKNVSSFTQHELASSCSVSLGLVNFALRPLRRMGAVSVRQRGLEVLDPWKALMYWCAVRNLAKEVVYSNFIDEPIHRIEASLPADSIPTAYTAYRERFGDAPADYSEVYAYGSRGAFVKRFGGEGQSRRRNLYALRSDEHLASLGEAPLAQLFADLWNIDTWYARRFLEGLSGRLKRTMPGSVP